MSDNEPENKKKNLLENMQDWIKEAREDNKLKKTTGAICGAKVMHSGKIKKLETIFLDAEKNTIFFLGDPEIGENDILTTNQGNYLILSPIVSHFDKEFTLPDGTKCNRKGKLVSFQSVKRSN